MVLISPLQTGAHGHLLLHFTYNHALQQTELSKNQETPPLRVLRPFPLKHGGALLHLHNVSGGILGGDQLNMEIEIGPQASVQLTTVGATRVYRSRPTMPPAVQQTTIHIQPGALLEYLPDPLIPFAGARYQQHTRIELAENAGLFWWETLAPGRLASGESLAYDFVHISSDLYALNRPIACERLRLEPQHANLTSPLRLGTYPYMTTFYLCHTGQSASRWLTLEEELSILALSLSQ